MGNLDFWVFVGLGLCMAISSVITAISICTGIEEVRKGDDPISENRILGITICAFVVTLVLYTILLILLII